MHLKFEISGGTAYMGSRFMSDTMNSAQQKAFAVNMDNSIYGAIAEIGAGQEVARWFFKVGGAAGTIAKSMSAYDMVVSDAIYGQSDRYVSRQRLMKMLDHEYDLLIERLSKQRGNETRFFAFADTVAAKSYRRKGENHGWLGVRFQTEPGKQPNDIIVHVRMLDDHNIQQQEALGTIGVNLIHSAYFKWEKPEEVIQALMDDLSPKRIEVDMIKFTGPDFEKVDNRLMSLQLVQSGLTHATMFLANGEVVQPAETLYNKCVLVERGSFRPVTNTTLNMLECAQAQFVQEPNVEGKNIEVLLEMTLNNLLDGGAIDHQDFLDRADLLGSMGRPVLISNYAEFHRLAAYLFRYTKEMCGIVIGVPTLKEIFEEKYYGDLEGGILESFGRLFKNDLKLYVHPLKDSKSGALITAGNLRVASNLRHLYSYLNENQFIMGLRDYKEDYLPIYSRDVLEKMQSGDPGWEQMVPPQVAVLIKERKLFGYKEG